MLWYEYQYQTDMCSDTYVNTSIDTRLHIFLSRVLVWKKEASNHIYMATSRSGGWCKMPSRPAKGLEEAANLRLASDPRGLQACHEPERMTAGASARSRPRRPCTPPWYRTVLAAQPTVSCSFTWVSCVRSTAARTTALQVPCASTSSCPSPLPLVLAPTCRMTVEHGMAPALSPTASLSPSALWSSLNPTAEKPKSSTRRSLL